MRLPGLNLCLSLGLYLMSVAMADVIIPVPLEFKPCQSDKDCVKVEETSCSSCCDEDALNRDSTILYQQLFQKICAPDKKKPCSCKPSGSAPKCVDGSCQLGEAPPPATPTAP